MSAIHKKALKHFGEAATLAKISEEMCELSAVINKIIYLRLSGENSDHLLPFLIEEIADVQVVLKYINVLPITAGLYRDIDRVRQQKIQRLAKELDQTVSEGKEP